MAIRERDLRAVDTRFGARVNGGAAQEEPVGDLLKRFGQDASTLVRQEITLAKLELRESAKGLAKDAGKLGAAAGLALFGGMAFLAFLIVALGELIGNYWLSALIISVLLLGAAALLGKSALARLEQRGMTPREFVQTLKEDKRWAKREVHDFKQSVKASR